MTFFYSQPADAAFAITLGRYCAGLSICTLRSIAARESNPCHLIIGFWLLGK
jgi:hypothetical protein